LDMSTMRSTRLDPDCQVLSSPADALLREEPDEEEDEDEEEDHREEEDDEDDNDDGYSE
jgi:hypothetical protein